MAFLVFEGLDGSGKSSLMRALEAELSKKGISFHRTREPGGTPLGDEVRNMILRKQEGTVPVPRAELLLYEVSRAQHVDEVIKPKLAEGVWVLSDRFSASSVAFQAAGRAIREEDVVMLNTFATGGLKADLTVLLDLTVAESRQRQAQRTSQTGEAADRIESEKDSFHQLVRDSFLKQAKEDPTGWLVLDARSSTEEMLKILLQTLKEKKWLVS
ncbi:MAG: dTMP kinase [Bdellovibrionales bacterium]|nr:dTMP kinase [Bdellovibrionales bacterium]